MQDDGLAIDDDDCFGILYNGETFLVAASWRNRRIEVCSQSEKRKSVPVSAFSLELSWRQTLNQMPKANQSILTW
jgi:hypothetical protein